MPIRFPSVDENGDLIGAPRTRVEEMIEAAGDVAEGNAKRYVDVELGEDRARLDTIEPRVPGYTDAAYLHAFTDSDGVVALGVRDDGRVELQGGSVGALDDAEGYLHAFTDAAGRVALGVRADGAVEAGGAPVVTTTSPKRSPLALTLSGSDSAAFGQDTRSAVHARLPFSPPVDLTIKAVHIRNHNDIWGKPYAGALSFNGVWIGEHVITPTGLTGQFKTAPARIASSFTTATTGAEYVIDGLNIPVARDTEMLLSYGYTCADGQVNHKAVGGAWTTPTLADAMSAAPAGLTREQFAPLDIWLEVEHSAPVVAWLADSIGCGLLNDTPVYTAPGMIHARANRVFPMLYCQSGSTMASWTSPQGWKYDKWAAMSKPGAVVWELGRNDLTSGADLATMKARFEALYPVVAARISPNIYMTTTTPKADDETSSDGVVRRDWVTHQRTLVGGPIRSLFDTAKAVQRPGGTALDPGISSDNTHFTSYGSALIAQTITHKLA